MSESDLCFKFANDVVSLVCLNNSSNQSSLMDDMDEHCKSNHIVGLQGRCHGNITQGSNKFHQCYDPLLVTDQT